MPEFCCTIESMKSIDSSNCTEIDLDSERENYSHTHTRARFYMCAERVNDLVPVLIIIITTDSHIENMKHLQMKTKVVYKIRTTTTTQFHSFHLNFFEFQLTHLSIEIICL